MDHKSAVKARRAMQLDAHIGKTESLIHARQGRRAKLRPEDRALYDELSSALEDSHRALLNFRRVFSMS